MNQFGRMTDEVLKLKMEIEGLRLQLASKEVRPKVKTDLFTQYGKLRFVKYLFV